MGSVALLRPIHEGGAMHQQRTNVKSEQRMEFGLKLWEQIEMQVHSKAWHIARTCSSYIHSIGMPASRPRAVGLLATSLALALALPKQAMALCPASGTPIIVDQTGTVTATFVYTNPTTEYSDDLYLDNDDNQVVIFNNKRDAVGTTKVLGPFNAGTELRFRLHVNDTSRNYFSGAAERNPDKLPHVKVTSTTGGSNVAFEDLYGLPECPDGSFTDLVFSFSNTRAQFVGPDRFVNFKTTPGTGAQPFTPRTVSLRDRFNLNGVSFDLGAPFRLALPASTPSNKAKTPDVALTGYALTNGAAQTPAVLRVTSELGRIRVTLGNADRLLVPSSFSRTGLQPLPSTTTGAIVDPLNCYSVRYKAAGFAKLKKSITVRSKYSKVNTYRIVSAVRLCTPATIDASDFLPGRTDTHMMCFNVQPANGIKAKRRNNVLVNDSIGSSTINTVRDREVCLPSTLEAL